jgi:glycosyltransferase involved in cell wall biosynthesis
LTSLTSSSTSTKEGAGKRRSTPARIVYCEGNVDGTIGGSYYSLLYLVKNLDRRRFEPVVVFQAEHSLLPSFREAGVETVVWRKVPPFTFAGRAAGMPAWMGLPLAVAQKVANFLRCFLLQAVRRALFLRRRRVQIVHLNNSVLYNHEWMLAARLAHERGINDTYPREARFWARRVDAVVCISQAVRRQLEQRGLDHGQLVDIPNGLDPEELATGIPAAELRRVHRLTVETPVVVMVGNLKPWKGQETVLRAMALVCSKHRDAHCFFVGATAAADRPFEDRLRALAADLGLRDRIVFVGFRENVTDYMHLADVVVHSSVRPEPFGRVALEAMACRKPFIGSDAGGIPEIVDHGRTGLTYPPGDVERLADAVVWVIENRQAAMQMGERGYERLIAKFHIAGNVQATEALYTRLLGGQPVSPDASVSTELDHVRR